VDDLRAAHERKKNSLFSGSDENAMETFVNLQRAKDAEEELRQIVIATRGFSAWGELQAIRVQARKDRKAKVLAEKKRKQKMMERFIIYGGSIAIVAITIGMTVVIILAKQGRI
jgi:catalase